MGYDTVYWLTWEEEFPSIEQVTQAFAEQNVDNVTTEFGSEQAIKYWQGVLGGDHEARWYEHQVEMAQVSKNWPEVAFQLEGDGEAGDDHWQEYFRNGKVHAVEGKPVFPEFDPEELAEPTRLIG